MTPPPSNVIGALLALAAFAVYATHDVLIKFLGGSYSPFQLIFFSGLLGFPLVTLAMMRDRTDGNLIPKLPLWTAIRTATAVIGAVASFHAFSVLPLAQVYAIFFTMPILITLMAIPLLGEKVGLHRGLAIVVGLLGVVVVLRPGQADLGFGHLAALAGAMLGAATSVIVRKVGGAERAVVLMLYPMMANFVVMGLALPFVYVPVPPQHFAMMAGIAALGLIGGALIIAAYRRAPAIIVAPMQYSQIIWAIIFGHVIFGEDIDLTTGIGTLIIIAAGVYIVLREDTPDVSKNRPVLETRSRFETGALPRISQMLRLFERRG
ncbi:MAG: DMT family transporter [Cypionkella sp.]|nr:DMT family transporter [Cypionkella sp.]